MMVAVLLVIAFVFFFYVKNARMDKPSKIILGIYGGYFLLSLYGSTIGYRGMYVPRPYTYFILLLTFVSFIIGFSMIKIRKDNANIADALSKDLDAVSNCLLVKILAYSSCIYVVSKIMVFWASIAIYASVGHMRTDFYEGSLYGPEFPYVNLVLGDLFYFFIPLFSYLTFKKRGLLWVAIGVFLLGYVTLGGGRFGYVFIFLGIVLTELILKISKIKTFKMATAITVIGALFFLILVVMTNARKGIYENEGDYMNEGVESTLGTMISYSSGPVIAFDRVVYDNRYPEVIGGYKLGRLTFSSVDLLLDYVTSFLFGFSIEPALSDISFKQENFLKIGPDTEWNALYTAALIYYLDLDIFGCILFPFLIGLLFRFFIKCMYRLPTFSMLVLVYFFFKATLFSVMDYSFYFAFDFVLVVLMYYDWKERKRNHKGLFISRKRIAK